jgi:Holliday junction resolvase
MESKIQAKIIKKLEAEGYYVLKLMKTNKNGIPDLIALPKDCNAVFYEIKSKTGSTSKLQDFRIKELTDFGVVCKVVDDPNQVP